MSVRVAAQGINHTASASGRRLASGGPFGWSWRSTAPVRESHAGVPTPAVGSRTTYPTCSPRSGAEPRPCPPSGRLDSSPRSGGVSRSGSGSSSATATTCSVPRSRRGAGRSKSAATVMNWWPRACPPTMDGWRGFASTPTAPTRSATYRACRPILFRPMTRSATASSRCAAGFLPAGSEALAPQPPLVPRLIPSFVAAPKKYPAEVRARALRLYRESDPGASA